MTNPYQAPLTTSEAPLKSGIPLWRRLLGLLCMLLAGPIGLYGLFVIAMVLWFARASVPGPVSTWIVFVAGGLIFTLGVGLGAMGGGLWVGHAWWARRGALAVAVSILAYLAVVMVFV